MPWEIYIIRSQEKNFNLNRDSNFWISSPALYHLSYPGSHASSCFNLPLVMDATLARRCGHDTVCHLLTTSELTSYFTWIWCSNQIINWRQTHNLCIGKFTLSDLKRKIRTSDLRISGPALYHLSYPGSHASSFPNLPLE